MTRTSSMPVGADVRARLRAAQRAESEAIAAVQKAQAAEADARARVNEIILKHQAELSKAARAVYAAQVAVVRTSGLDRAAALLDVSSKELKSAIKESAQDTRGQASRAHATSAKATSVQATSVQATSVQVTSDKTPAATTAPTIAPTDT